MEHLVVLAHRYAEYDRSDVLEAVYPLLPFRALPAHIEQLEVEVFEREVDLHDARRLDPGAQDVLLGRLVVLRAQPVQSVKEANPKD